VRSDSTSGLLGLAVLLSPLVYYVLACWMYPYRACRHCKGGRVSSPSGRYYGDCRHCAGKGGQLRLGRRIWDRRH
jgi:hypothetical protein